MDDIEQICNRLIMIDKGKIIYDGTLNNFKKIYSGGYMIIVDFADENIKIQDVRLKILKEEGPRKFILCNKKEISAGEAITLLTRNYDVVDLSLKEPEIEEVVRNIYETKDNLYNVRDIFV